MVDILSQIISQIVDHYSTQHHQPLNNNEQKYREICCKTKQIAGIMIPFQIMVLQKNKQNIITLQRV